MNDVSIFKYESKEVRTVDVEGETFWVAKDVCEVLDIKNNRQATEQLDEDEVLSYVLHTTGQGRETTLVNESGLYSLIIRSNKPEAKKFKKWITSVVLPSIRKTGRYEVEGKTSWQLMDESYKRNAETLRLEVESRNLKNLLDFAEKSGCDCKNCEVSVSVNSQGDHTLTIKSLNKEEQ